MQQRIPTVLQGEKGEIGAEVMVQAAHTPPLTLNNLPWLHKAHIEKANIYPVLNCLPGLFQSFAPTVLGLLHQHRLPCTALTAALWYPWTLDCTWRESCSFYLDHTLRWTALL